ncbi:MAG: transglutaminase domain-containing protein [Spirochaetales bacterium]|nr:transglutaminase domain-containing protein [Spirochaetales bacterium]
MFSRRYLLLFYTRLCIYLVAVGIPIFHPAVVVSYDALIRWLWFLLVPAQMHIAFFLSPPKFSWKLWTGASAGLTAVSLIVFTGFTGPIGLFLLVQTAAFASTVLVFRSRGLLRPFVFAEMLLLLVLFIRLLGFSRAAEEFAAASSAITQGILAISLGVVLLHGFVLYLSVYGEGLRKRSGRELALFLTIAAAIGVAAAMFLPADFVKHSISLNDLKNPPDPDFLPLDEYGEGLEDGNLLSDRQGNRDGRDGGEGGNRNDGEGDGDAGQRLQGIPAEQWESRGRSRSGSNADSESGDEGGRQTGSGEGEDKQYAVMVVAGKQDPIYAADAYFGDLDPEHGFLLSRDNPLNELAYLRLIETWENPAKNFDLSREIKEVFFLSTESVRFLPYDPQAVQPTVLNRIYHPFDFSYASLSAISQAGEAEFGRIIGLNERERQLLAPYLEVEITAAVREKLSTYLGAVISDELSYYERIAAIIQAFSTFQYNIGFTDEVSIDHIVRFLFETKDGDCSEFSNSAALLARMAGIPSRVVTGYLASSGLQTRMHKRGLAALQEVIQPLQQFSLDEMYLVTTAHRHSWTQVYMPGYGWIDIETTATAMPPVGGLNPNSTDIVIPIIEPENVLERKFEFPWLLTLQALLVLMVAGTAGAYAYRYGRLVYLKAVSRGESVRSLRAIYSLLLARLAAEGYPIKPVSHTVKEYAGEHPELEHFAELYTTLRYRQRLKADKRELEFQKLRVEYRNVVESTKRSGFTGLLKRVFTLRDLRY